MTLTHRSPAAAIDLQPVVPASNLLAACAGLADLNGSARRHRPGEHDLAWTFRYLHVDGPHDPTYEVVGVSTDPNTDILWWHHYLTGSAAPLGDLTLDGWQAVFGEIRFAHGETWLLRLDRPHRIAVHEQPAPLHVQLQQEISFSRWLREISNTEQEVTR